jgi:hypothetical protein
LHDVFQLEHFLYHIKQTLKRCDFELNDGFLQAMPEAYRKTCRSKTLITEAFRGCAMPPSSLENLSGRLPLTAETTLAMVTFKSV